MILKVECDEEGRQFLLGVGDSLLRTGGRQFIPMFNLLEKHIPPAANVKEKKEPPILKRKRNLKIEK